MAAALAAIPALFSSMGGAAASGLGAMSSGLMGGAAAPVAEGAVSALGSAGGGGGLMDIANAAAPMLSGMPSGGSQPDMGGIAQDMGQPPMQGAQLMPNVNAPKEDISKDFDPFAMAQNKDIKGLAKAYPDKAVNRSMEMADRGLGYAQAPDAGASSMDLQGLMSMMQGQMGNQGGSQPPSPNQVPAYMNKYIQGLLGGM